MSALRRELASLAGDLEPVESAMRSSGTRPIASTAVPSVEKKRGKRSIALWLTFLFVVALAGALTWRGFDFYMASSEARLDHPDYRILSPTGTFGQGYGVVGTGLILLNLLYLVRRRFAWLPLGSMQVWLHMHVFTGLTGSLLIVFHSAFRLRSPIASVTAASLGAVVLTGLVGRYIYALSPKPGQVVLEERLAEIELVLPSFVQALRARLAGCPATQVKNDPSLLLVIATLPRWILDARRRRRAVKSVASADAQLLRLRKKEPKFVRALTREVVGLAAHEVDALAGSALLRTWRSVHRFMAILMILAVAIHIGVAWHYGYRWLLSE